MWLAGLGAALATIGSALLSWSTATAHTTEQATEVLRPQLEGLARRLGSAAGQIKRAVADCDAGLTEEDVSFALISQGAGSLYGIVADIQLLTQTNFNSETLVETTVRIDDLASRLLREGPSNASDEERAEMADELRTLIEQVRTTVRPSSAHREKVEEKVACPYCDTMNRVSLGVAVGDSAGMLCERCGDQLHVHRRSDQTPFVRGEGPNAASRLAGEEEAVRGLAMRLSRTGTPLLSSEQYEVFFDVAAEVFSEGTGHFTWTSKAIRDRCTERGNPIARSAVNFLLNGLRYQGIQFSGETTAAVLALAIRENVRGLCKQSGITLTDSEFTGTLSTWIRSNTDGSQTK